MDTTEDHDQNYPKEQIETPEHTAAPKPVKGESQKSSTWLPKVLIVIFTALLSAIFVTLTAYWSGVSRSEIEHKYKMEEIQKDSVHRKAEAEKQKETDRITSNIKKMTECAKEFRTLQGIVLMSGGTLKTILDISMTTEGEGSSFAKMTQNTMRMDQATRRIKQMTEVESLIPNFPPDSKVGALFSQYVLATQQYLQNVDDILNCALSEGKGGTCSPEMLKKFHEFFNGKDPNWLKIKIKSLEQPKEVIACYQKVVKAMDQAISARERQLSDTSSSSNKHSKNE